METLELAESGTSPFVAGRVTSGESTDQESFSAPTWAGTAASPFVQGLATADGVEAEHSAWASLTAELTEESFEDAVEALVDEVAARHLRSTTTWASHAEASQLAARDAGAWLDEVGSGADRLLAELAEQYADRSPESVTEGELEGVLERLPVSEDPLSAVSEQFLGGLVKKAFKAAKGVAKAGLSAVSKLLPVGKLFGLLRKLLPSLLKRVLDTALNRLPASVRGPATELARKLMSREAERGEGVDDDGLAAEFDAQLAGLLLAPNDAALEELLGEAAAEASAAAEDDPMVRLDAARAHLTRELLRAEPGRPPVELMEQFIPAVMAALPLVRAGVKVVGRQRVRSFLATALAGLIQGYVGPVAARALAPHVADAGMRLLRLEAESSDVLGAESLVSTLEETIAAVSQLPDSALEDPLRLELEVGEAFAEAAGRLLPRDVLRPDLETLETDDEDGQQGEAWILMPRRAVGSRRYRKLARVYDVVISRPRARAIVLGEDTLEERLLDAGVDRWPVHAEAHVYETVLGTRLGHLAAFEGDGVPALPAEFEQLTPTAAALLVGRPGRGRALATAGAGAPGRRLVRLVVPGKQIRRRRSRIALRLVTTAAQPELRVHLRLGERSAHLLAGHLAKQALPDALGVVRRLVGPAVRERLAARLARQLSRASGAPVAAARGQQLGSHVAETMLAVLSQQLPTRAAELETAAKDARPGLTLTFGFRFADRAALSGGQPQAPSLTIRPGWRSD